MWWLLIPVLIAPFILAAIMGAPYLPTRPRHRQQVLEFAKLEAGDILVDLGSGDGILLALAARRGIRCVGYEINPLLWTVSKLVTWRHRKLVTIHLRDFWNSPLPGADVIYAFLSRSIMSKLDEKLSQEICRPTRVVSIAFPIPNRPPDATLPFAFRYTFGVRRRSHPDGRDGQR